MDKAALSKAFENFNIEVDKRWTCSTMRLPPVRYIPEQYEYYAPTEPNGIVSYGIYSRQDRFNPPATL